VPSLLTCRSHPIHFAISSVRFVSREEIAILRIGDFASVKYPGLAVPQARNTQEIFLAER
jgi:hypothetical protein